MRWFIGGIIFIVLFNISGITAQPQAFELIQLLEKNFAYEKEVFYRGELKAQNPDGTTVKNFFFLRSTQTSKDQTRREPSVIFQCASPLCTILQVGEVFWEYSQQNGYINLQDNLTTKAFGSLFTYRDIMHADSLSEYDWKIIGRSPSYSEQNKETVWELEGVRKVGGKATYPKLRLSVMEKKGVLLRETFFNDKMEIDRVLIFKNTEPTSLACTMVDVNKSGYRSEYCITQFCFPVTFPPEIFTQSNLPNIFNLKIKHTGKTYDITFPYFEKLKEQELSKQENLPTYSFGYKPFSFYYWAHERYSKSEGVYKYIWIGMIILSLIADIIAIAVLGVAYLIEKHFGNTASQVYFGGLGVSIILSFLWNKFVSMVLFITGMLIIGITGGSLLGGYNGALIGGVLGILLSLWECALFSRSENKKKAIGSI